jgi:hypothetical protein
MRLKAWKVTENLFLLEEVICRAMGAKACVSEIPKQPKEQK